MFSADYCFDGLASVVVISPNDRYLREYTAAEDKARKLRRGIWSLSFCRPRSSVIESIAGGYAFVHGTIEKVELGDMWFNPKLGTSFWIGVLTVDWQTNSDYSPWQLEHAEVVVRGWASRRGTSSRVVVDHPFMLEHCGPDTPRLCPAKVDLTSPTQ